MLTNDGAKTTATNNTKDSGANTLTPAKLEKACIDTIEGGTMTKDLAALWEKDKAHVVTSDGFLAAVRTRLERSL